MYRFILAQEAVFFFAQLEPDEQQGLVPEFEDLARNPSRRGLASFRDADGRENLFFRAGEFLLTLRLDHAEKEIRVVGIERI